VLPLKALAVWLAILALAVANGALREGVLLARLSRSAAFTLSGILLIACILLVALLSIRWLGASTASQCVAVGLFWLALTLVFEFGFGLLVRGQSLSTVLDAYRFRQGNLWPLVLLVVAVAPAIAAFARGVLAPGKSP
jgi:hypothetical protein